MRPYDQVPGLGSVYFEDSFVLGIEEAPDCLSFELDLVLRESHALYRPPGPDQQYCYRRARLDFPRLRRVCWNRREIKPTLDASGSKDYGNIDAFTEHPDGVFHLEGDWGAVTVESSHPTITVK